MFGVVALFSLAPPDNADTAFNEMDRPLIVSYATLPQARLAAPTITARRVLDGFRRSLQIPNSALTYGREQDRFAARSGDLQKMLCVFLI
jgi:hypothetical protein